ncbi:sterol desaturase family protein [Gammaproteobacteria bacterium]|nr:sterol desaturase family protein [Gammaproteobacteria bacterium]
MDKSFLIFLAVPLFFLMAFIEFLWGLKIGKNNYRINDAFTGVALGLISRFPTILNIGFQGAVFAFAATSLNLKLLPADSIFTVIFAIIMYDFCYYWMHRMSHERKFLWATHVVHHHGEEFNLITAMRQTSSGFLIKWIFFTPILIVGIPPQVFVLAGGINLIYQFWVHTEHIGKLGWMEKVFITPSNHRIHHAKNPEYIDANYGGIFILWDRLFGTYIEEKDNLKPLYGTVTPLRSFNPVWANIEIFWQMIRDSFYTKNWGDKIKVWFGRTGWRPADVALKFPGNQNKTPLEEKFNPPLPLTGLWYGRIQIVIMPLIAMSIFFTLGDQVQIETIIFGLFIFTSAFTTSMVLLSSKFALWIELLRAPAVLFLIFQTSLIDSALLASNLFAVQAIINILFIVGTKIALTPFKPLNT